MLSAACVLGAVAPAIAATFDPSSVVVYRVGAIGASTALDSSAAPVFLDEYSPSGTLLQSVPLPTATNGANRALTASGTAGSEGLLNRSVNGQYLMLTGYDAAPGTATVKDTDSSVVNRVVGRVDGLGGINTTTAISSVYGGNNFRSAASPDGVSIFVSGSSAGDAVEGVARTTLGNGGTISSLVDFATRNVGIYGGQLFAGSASAGAPSVVVAVGTGQPSSGPVAANALPGLPNNADPEDVSEPGGFVLLDLSPSVAGLDTLYLADATGQALRKYSLVAGEWAQNGEIGAGADDYTGLAATVNGDSVTLFATRLRGDNADEFVRLVDASGYNGAFAGTPDLLATAGANTAFRGVALAPIPEPTTLGLLAPAGLLLLRRRRGAQHG